MNRTLKLAFVAGLSFAGLGFAAETASAAPMAGLDNAVAHQSDVQAGVQDVRYFCGRWGCRWAPGPYPYYGYGYYRPYWGWGRPWGWGWGRRW
ncbi:MAG TPA: hypothetical protein VGG12_01570 [Methylovirgula sp.]